MPHKRIELQLGILKERYRRAEAPMNEEVLPEVREKLEGEAETLKQLALARRAEEKLQQAEKRADQPPSLRRHTPQPDTGKQPLTDQPGVLEPHAYTERGFGKRAEGGPEIGKEREAYTGGSPEAIEGRFGGEWPKPKPEESYDAETRLRNL